MRVSTKGGSRADEYAPGAGLAELSSELHSASEGEAAAAAFDKLVALQRKTLQKTLASQTSRLNLGCFFVAVVDHFFYPYSLSWILCRDGWPGVRNRKFLPSVEHISYVDGQDPMSVGSGNCLAQLCRYYRSNEGTIWNLFAGLMRAAAHGLLIEAWFLARPTMSRNTPR